MSRWLVRFGYDGSGFSGWARQPRSKTIEGVLLQGLHGRGIAPSPEAARVEVASRTDRGVSARANALAIESELTGAMLLRRLNTISPELFFTAATPIPAEFRVRAAIRRVYRYFDPSSSENPTAVDRAAALFRGRVDVRSFGRGIPARAPHWRNVESVTVQDFGGGRMIEVRAPSFVWGMVRKIVGALREVDQGRLSAERLGAAVSGKERLTLPLAEPEGLVLWEVEYPIEWGTSWPGPNRHQVSQSRSLIDGLWTRTQVLASLFQNSKGSRRASSDGDPHPG